MDFRPKSKEKVNYFRHISTPCSFSYLCVDELRISSLFSFQARELVLLSGVAVKEKKQQKRKTMYPMEQLHVGYLYNPFNILSIAYKELMFKFVSTSIPD